MFISFKNANSNYWSSFNGEDYAARAPRSSIVITVRREDHPRPAALMGDKTFEDMLGEFTLRERGHVETGSPLGEWIVIDHTPVFFQPRDKLIEKLYLLPRARELRCVKKDSRLIYPSIPSSR